MIEEQVKQFITENFLFSEEKKITETDSFLENGIIDSTGVLELVSFVEEKFNVKVKDEEMIPENLDSINNLANFIKKKQNGGSGA
ncbi:MAG: acyl carrier protein [Nitrospirae bacterium]|nr:acyl carrier protein [Nitrospirota bacterium]